MPSIYGQRSTLSAQDADLRISIEDLIHDYPDWQFPLLKRLDSKIFDKGVTSHKYEWSTKDLRPTKAEVASATVAADATTFYVDISGVFNVDDIAQLPDGEQVVVIAVSGGTLLTVIRGWGGTTPETMVLGETVKRVGVASRQGAKADEMVVSGLDDLYNFTQIFEDVVELSDTDHKAMIRGQETQPRLITRKQKELMEMHQNTIIAGTRYMDKQNKRYSSGGIKYFIDTYAAANKVNFGGSTTWNTDSSVIDKLDDSIALIANQMGGKPTIYISYLAMRKLKKVDGALVITDRKDKARGTAMPEKYLSQIGELDIVQIRERTGVMDDFMFFVDESDIGYKAFNKRGWFTEELAKDGDNHKWQIVGEYTFKMEHPKAHSYIYNMGF